MVWSHKYYLVSLWCRMETRKCRPNVIVVLLFPFLLYHKLYFLHLICVACPCWSNIHYPRQQIPYCWLFVVCKSSWNHGWLSTAFPDGFWLSLLYFIDWKPNFQPHQISLKSKSQTLFFQKTKQFWCLNPIQSLFFTGDSRHCCRPNFFSRPRHQRPSRCSKDIAVLAEAPIQPLQQTNSFALDAGDSRPQVPWVQSSSLWKWASNAQCVRLTGWNMT